MNKLASEDRLGLLPVGGSDVSVGSSASEASVDLVSALVETGLRVLIGFGVEVSAVPEPDGGLEGILGEGGISGVGNEVTADSLTSILVVGSSSNLDGASSLEFDTVASEAVTQVLASSFVFSTGGEFFHVLEFTGFFSNLTEESRDSGASVDGAPVHGIDEVGIVSGELALVGLGEDGLELSKGDTHGERDGEEERKDQKDSLGHLCNFEIK